MAVADRLAGVHRCASHGVRISADTTTQLVAVTETVVASSRVYMRHGIIPPPLVAQNLEIHVINVGWSGAVLVKGPNGTTVMTDAGNTGKGMAELVPDLQSIGICGDEIILLAYLGYIS